MSNSTLHLDPQSETFLSLLADQERVKAQKIPGVKTVLVVLSAGGMVYDTESLQQKILLTYPDATVFFRTTDGKSVGSESPRKVDLLLDFTGPGQRQGLFYARKLKGISRVSLGRNAGLFRKKLYTKIFDEKNASGLPQESLARERIVQKAVLALAGISMAQRGDTPADRGKTIALELPPLTRI